MISAEELKGRPPTCDAVAHDLYGIEFLRNAARCPFPANHNNGDRDPSLRYDPKKDRIFCASQQCFGEKGVDAFGLANRWSPATSSPHARFFRIVTALSMERAHTTVAVH